jgi:DNA repair photolyase
MSVVEPPPGRGIVAVPAGRAPRAWRIVRKTLCHARLGSDIVDICSHACIYCYTKQITRAKPELPDVIKLYDRMPEQLDRFFEENPVKYPFRYGVFADVCAPFEATTKVFREVLRVHLKHEYPTIVFTKVPLHRWIPDDLLKLAEKGLLAVSVTITTVDREMARFFEPRAPSPSLRVEFIEWLEDHRIPWSVRITPLYQGLTDSPERVEQILNELPRGHAIFEFLRVDYNPDLGFTRESAEFLVRFFREKGVDPWKDYQVVKTVRGYFTVPEDYGRRRMLEIRDLVHRKGFSFAICGHYIRFKIQDYRDCCTGPHDFYGKFMPYDPGKARVKLLREFIERELPKTPLMLWKDKDVDLVTGERI